ncbi:MAG: ABC transporter C-terminal domain-containing protein, partial [Cyclobacteriaceae bacterium]
NQQRQEEYKALQKSLKKFQKSMEEAEANIARMEKEKKILEAEMAKPAVYSDPEKLQEVNQKYDGLKKLLEEETEKWEAAAMEVDEVEEKIAENE